MGAGGSVGFGRGKKPEPERLPRYADVDNVVVRPAAHVPLSEEPGGTGQFCKMTDRPLMSLIEDGEGRHRGGSGLPTGMRTDGIYFLPSLPAEREPAERESGAEEENSDSVQRSVPLLQTISGRSDRVYFLVGKGIHRDAEGPG